ncbi:MAG: tail fiber domain-containing protein, partial [Bacteroidota bacterium]
LKLSGTDNQGRTLTIFDGSPDGNYWSMYTESASPSATFRISHNELGNTFTINNQGNVGIGSGNAEAKLQIRGPLTDEGQLKITSSGDNGTRISLGNSVDRNFWYIDGSISDPFIEIGHKRNQNNPILAMAPFSDNQLGGILSARGQMIITSQNKLSGLSITEILSGELPFSGAYYGTYSNISGNGFTSSGAIDMVGLFSRASGSQGKARLVVGVEATAIEGQNGTYGVLAKAEAEKFDYAVYADGNVFSTGSYLPSDRKLKSNIQPLQKGLSTIMALRPTSFRYDKNNSQHMDLPGGEQYGLIAQEVEVLLPGLTKKSYHAYAMRDSTALHGGFAFTAVNYVGLIPFLISATQEQQQIINRQNQLLTTQAGQIQELMGKFRQLEARLEAVSYSLSSSYQSN